MFIMNILILNKKDIVNKNAQDTIIDNITISDLTIDNYRLAVKSELFVVVENGIYNVLKSRNMKINGYLFNRHDMKILMNKVEF